jgi:hypothetical protein
MVHPDGRWSLFRARHDTEADCRQPGMGPTRCRLLSLASEPITTRDSSPPRPGNAGTPTGALRVSCPEILLSRGRSLAWVICPGDGHELSSFLSGRRAISQHPPSGRCLRPGADSDDPRQRGSVGRREPLRTARTTRRYATALATVRSAGCDPPRVRPFGVSGPRASVAV